MLVKNNIRFDGKNPGINADDIYTIARPKPNQKFLGTARVKLYFYNKGTKGKPNSKFRTWLRDKVGERPVVYDSAAAKNSAFEMQLYLNKIGYFYSDVNYSMEAVRK